MRAVKSEDFDPFSLKGDAALSNEHRSRLEGEGSPPRSPDSADVFDPFGLGKGPVLGDDMSSTASPRPPPAVSRSTRSGKKKRQAGMALPPKLVVKFTAHEEVSSVAKGGSDGGSEISVEGTLRAQMQSSDAKKNSPFALVASSFQGRPLSFQGADGFARPSQSTRQTTAAPSHIVTIPKSAVTGVTIGRYTLTEEVRHMPILVERKTTFYGKQCRVMVQVRSKLNNMGDMTDFTVVVAIPEKVNGDTVQVTRGSGVWDDLKRTIKWKLPVLPTGESTMICAQAELWTPVSDEADHPVFPVLLRCSSAHDQISSAQFRASDAEGYPANVAYSRTSSFRLLHRLV